MTSHPIPPIRWETDFKIILALSSSRIRLVCVSLLYNRKYQKNIKMSATEAKAKETEEQIKKGTKREAEVNNFIIFLKLR